MSRNKTLLSLSSTSTKEARSDRIRIIVCWR
jgi:hypothetical protein